jgi:hypothetical protein
MMSQGADLPAFLANIKLLLTACNPAAGPVVDRVRGQAEGAEDSRADAQDKG